MQVLIVSGANIEIKLFMLELWCYTGTIELLVPGGFAAGNRGADFVQHLTPLRAGTRYCTGHRTPISTAIRLQGVTNA